MKTEPQSIPAAAPGRAQPHVTGPVGALLVDHAGAAKLLGISESHLFSLSAPDDSARRRSDWRDAVAIALRS